MYTTKTKTKIHNLFVFQYQQLNKHQLNQTLFALFIVLFVVFIYVFGRASNNNLRSVQLFRCTSLNVIRDPYSTNRPGLVSIIPDVSPTPVRPPLAPLSQLQENAFPGRFNCLCSKLFISCSAN